MSSPTVSESPSPTPSPPTDPLVPLSIEDPFSTMAFTPDPSQIIDVNTIPGVVSIVNEISDTIYRAPRFPPPIWFDCEGVNLGRKGTVSILQLLLKPINKLYLVDIHTLGNKAFATRGRHGDSIKRILESKHIWKGIFDVRSDSDALFHHYGIKLAGIQDVQVMEIASRSFKRTRINGLKRCVERDLPMPADEKEAWLTMKETGHKLFSPEDHGSYEVFNERPLSDEVKNYCVQDVLILPGLWKEYHERLGGYSKWRARANFATCERIRYTHGQNYDGYDANTSTLPPSGWEYIDQPFWVRRWT